MDRHGLVSTCQGLAMWLAFYTRLCLYINVGLILFSFFVVVFYDFEHVASWCDKTLLTQGQKVLSRQTQPMEGSHLFSCPLVRPHTATM